VKLVLDWATLSLATLVTSSLWLGSMPQDLSPAPARSPTVLHKAPAFPPVPAASRIRKSTPVDQNSGDSLATDREIARLASALPDYQDNIRQDFDEAGDLYDYMIDLLPGAQRGDAASQYYLSMALEECRVYLRLDATAALATYEASSSWSAEDRVAWDRDYFRCRNFAGGDLAALMEALGDDRPGAVTEYASVWFERAARAGYPAAIAELALQRSRTLNRQARLDLLKQAVAANDAVVYWHLFAQTNEGETGRGSVASLAWLIVACRAGADCRDEAQWSRAWLCGPGAGAACGRDKSALEYYWHSLPPQDRQAAYQLAASIEINVQSGNYEQLPWPALRGETDVQSENARAEVNPDS